MLGLEPVDFGLVLDVLLVQQLQFVLVGSVFLLGLEHAVVLDHLSIELLVGLQ